MDRVEIGTGFSPKFDEDGLIPCITVDAESREVLMFAWMNRKALLQTVNTGRATYYSRSRDEIWVKGETSGRVQKVLEILVDCDQDVLQLRVEMDHPGSCHRGYRSCFYRRLAGENRAQLEFVDEPVFDSGMVYGRDRKQSQETNETE